MGCTRSRGSRGFQCLVSLPRPGEPGRYPAKTHSTAQQNRNHMNIETTKVPAKIRFEEESVGWSTFFDANFQIAECSIGDSDFWFGLIDVACKKQELTVNLGGQPKFHVKLEDGREGLATTLGAKLNSDGVDYTLLQIVGTTGLSQPHPGF